MKINRAARAAGGFALDRERFAHYIRREHGELVGIDLLAESGFAAAIECRFCDAGEAEAIVAPPGLEVIVYALSDSLIVAVREVEVPVRLPVNLRQLATISFETKYVADSGNDSFEEACAVIEALFERASALLPSFRAMQRGERRIVRRGPRVFLGGLLARLARRRR